MIVYTCLTDKTCPIPEQDIDKNHEYVFFHSVPVVKNSFWTYEKIDDKGDPLLTHMRMKILSHQYFKEDTLWIDPKLKLHRDLEPKKDFVINEHPYRKNFFEELLDWYLLPVINYKEAMYILDLFRHKKYNFKKPCSILSNVVYRKYTCTNVTHNERWFLHWEKFSKRDQLPFMLSSFECDLDYDLIAYKDYIHTLPLGHHQTNYSESLQRHNLLNLNHLIQEIQKIEPTFAVNKQLLTERVA